MIFNYPLLNTRLVNRMTKDKEETNDTSQEYTKDLKQAIIEYSETFDKNKKYVFSKERYTDHTGESPDWSIICDGMEVIVETEEEGIIMIDGYEKYVLPIWCEEVK